MRSPHALALGLLTLAACGAPPAHHTGPPDPRAPDVVLDLPVTVPPFDVVHAAYKERLAVPYVFSEERGDYRATGRRFSSLLQDLADDAIEAAGPPFALFFDDPGEVPVAELRSRACIPIAAELAGAPGTPIDVLPQATVVYAYVRGAYPDVPRSYPGLLEYARGLGWVPAGPIREIYLVAPASVRSPDELLCEVQIPVQPGR